MSLTIKSAFYSTTIAGRPAVNLLRCHPSEAAQRDHASGSDQRGKQQDAERAAERKSMVGTGDRSAKIRTYNFPQSRVTDHRIGLTVHSLDAIMQGDIEGIITAIHDYRRAEELAGSGDK